jgi:hypothetical protein
LKTIFTKIIDPSVVLNSEGDINQIKSPNTEDFTMEFSQHLSPFLTDLYFSPNLKDNFHFSVSNPRIFRILCSLCSKIYETNRKSQTCNSGNIVSSFQSIFRRSNIIQESASTILYNSSVQLFKSTSSYSSKQTILGSQIAQAINELSKDPVRKHFFKQISFGNYSSEIIDQIACLSQTNWVFSGNNELMKTQHLLISGLIHSLRTINPDAPVTTCDQLKILLTSAFDDHLRSRSSERVLILVDLSGDTSPSKDTLIHLILNHQFNLAFSKREIISMGKRLTKQRQTIFKKSGLKSAGDVSVVDVCNTFFSGIVSFCIWKFSSDFEEQRRLFLTFPRLDMRSFAEFIETNYIKNQIFICTELYNYLREVTLPLNNTTGTLPCLYLENVYSNYSIYSLLTLSHGLLHSFLRKLQLFLEKQVRGVGLEHLADSHSKHELQFSQNLGRTVYSEELLGQNQGSREAVRRPLIQWQKRDFNVRV